MRCTSFFVGAASCFNDLGVNRELTTPVLSPSHVCEFDTTDVDSPSGNAPILLDGHASKIFRHADMSIILRKEARIRTITLTIFSLETRTLTPTTNYGQAASHKKFRYAPLKCVRYSSDTIIILST